MVDDIVVVMAMVTMVMDSPDCFSEMPNCLHSRVHIPSPE